MKANELLKKLGNTLLGKKVNTPVAVGDGATVIQLATTGKATETAFRVRDGLGVIPLPEHWRN